MEPKFFATPADLRAWFEAHHDQLTEQWIGYFKKGSKRQSITWEESVDAALCFGWIDGVRKSIDSERYMIRFTPRKPGSIWSAVNIERVADLTAQGLMHPSGLAAYAARKTGKSVVYSYEQQEGDITLPEQYAAQLGANPAAATFFQAQPAWYQRSVIWWIISAKQHATQQKRLTQLIEDSAAGRTVKPFTRAKGK